MITGYFLDTRLIVGQPVDSVVNSLDPCRLDPRGVTSRIQVWVTPVTDRPRFRLRNHLLLFY